MEGLTGIISAHAFHYLAEVHPRANPQSRRFVATPRWFKKLFGVSEREGQRAERSVAGGVTGIAPRRGPQAGSPAAAPSTGGGYSWGRGNRLGTA